MAEYRYSRRRAYVVLMELPRVKLTLSLVFKADTHYPCSPAPVH